VSDLAALPGGSLVEAGLDDLAHGRTTIAALVVSMAPSRLREAGLVVHEPQLEPELTLHALLEEVNGSDAHARYRALRAELASFLAALDREWGRALRAGRNS